LFAKGILHNSPMQHQLFHFHIYRQICHLLHFSRHGCTALYTIKNAAANFILQTNIPPPPALSPSPPLPAGVVAHAIYRAKFPEFSRGPSDSAL
jgi:hypothetical protein